MITFLFIFVFDIKTYQPAARTPVVIIVGEDERSKHVRSQWERQYATDKRSRQWQEVFKTELARIHWYFDVKLVDYIDYPGRVPVVPSLRVGGGGSLSPLPKNAVCPCGCFIYHLDFVCRNYRYPSVNYEWHMKRAGWIIQRPHSYWEKNYKSYPKPPERFPVPGDISEVPSVLRAVEQLHKVSAQRCSLQGCPLPW